MICSYKVNKIFTVGALMSVLVVVMSSLENLIHLNLATYLLVLKILSLNGF